MAVIEDPDPRWQLTIFNRRGDFLILQRLLKNILMGQPVESILTDLNFSKSSKGSG
jgi:hypothetical protein